MKYSKVQVSSGFILLVALLLMFDNTGILLLLAISMAIHELGHYIAIKAFGGSITSLRFEFVGLEMQCDNTNVPYWGEMIIAVSGPMFSFLLAYGAALFGKLHASQDAYYLAGVSFILGLFNSMPVKQLDGGRTLYMLLAWLFGINIAEIVVCAVSCMTIFLLLLAGMMLLIVTRWNFTLLVFAVWLLRSYCKNEKNSIKYFSNA